MYKASSVQTRCKLVDVEGGNIRYPSRPVGGIPIGKPNKKKDPRRPIERHDVSSRSVAADCMTASRIVLDASGIRSCAHGTQKAWIMGSRTW